MAERVLIVDDSRQVREWMIAQVKSAGFNARGVADGMEALGILMNIPPDALVLDLVLPTLNGIELLRRLRASPHGAKMPVVVVTGVYKGEEHAARAKTSFGVDAYLEKPFRPEDLISALKKALEARKVQCEPPAPAPPAALEPVKPRHKIIAGDLAESPFDQLLLKIWNEHLTGVLRVKSPDEEGHAVERAFAFLSGRPVLGRSHAENEDFGTHMLSRGMATPEENREFQYLLARGQRDAEDIFIRMGCLTPDGYTIERVRHIEELIIRCFALQRGEFRFEESDLPMGAAAGALIPRIVHEGYRRHLTEQRMGILFQKLGGSYLSRTSKFHDYLAEFELNPDEYAFSQKIDGTHMLKDHLVGGNFHQMLKMFAAFLALDMVEPSNTPHANKVEPPYPVRTAAPVTGSAPQVAVPKNGAEQPAIKDNDQSEENPFEDIGGALCDELGDLACEPDLEVSDEERSAREAEEKEHRRIEEELSLEASKLQNRNYYEYFDIKPSRFRFEDMKSVYFEKRRKFSPENFVGWAGGNTISIAEQVFTQLTTAYNTLSNVVSKEKYDELLESTLPKVSGDAKVDRFQAQVQFESGKAFIEMSDWDSAVQALKEAIDLNPREAAAHAWLGWAIYSKNKQNKANVQAAKQEIATALKMDPRLAVAFTFRGSMLLDEDNLDMAEVELKRALKFNPQSKQAKRELKAVEERRESQKKGLFGRIFS